MKFRYNTTLDRLLLAAAYVQAGKTKKASKAMDDMMEDEDAFEKDVASLMKLQDQAATAQVEADKAAAEKVKAEKASKGKKKGKKGEEAKQKKADASTAAIENRLSQLK